MILTRAQAMTVKRAASSIGVPLPEQFAADLDAASSMAAAAEEIGDSSDALNAAVLDAISAGRDYHADPDVTRLLLDSVLVRQNNIGEAARQRANREIGATLAEHADTILAAWSHALEPHAKALASAAKELPTHDLSDTNTIIGRGASAMHHWSAAQTSLRIWAAAVDGFVSLATTARIEATKHNPRILTTAGYNALASLEVESRSTGTNLDAWAIACHGLPLKLATLGEYMERTAEYEQQRQAAAARAAAHRNEQERAALAR